MHLSRIKITSQSLVRGLKVLVLVAFWCNLMILPLVPGLVGMKRVEGLGMPPAHGNVGRQIRFFFTACWQYLWRIWREGSYETVLTLFLLFCGCCTAVILWQAKRVLDTIQREETFTYHNAENMKRAGICCLLIAVAAAIRLFWGIIYYQSLTPIFTYNALFVPTFLMAFLLCMVMSALFRQATALREENDLII